MKLQKVLSLVAGLGLVSSLTVGLWPSKPAVAAPLVAPLAQTNLLANGSLDSFATNGMANSWAPWWNEVAKPASGFNYAYKPEWAPEANPAFVKGGSGSQHIGNRWDPWHAGIRQTVSATPGSVIRITAYGKVFASTPDWPSPSDSAVQSRMQIGADPNGGIEWYSSNVKWSGTANPHDTWAQFTLDVTTGASGKVTIFLSTDYRGDSRYHLDAWWDEVSAVVVGQGTAATNTPGAGGATSAPPAATRTSAPFVSPTPGADGSIVYTVQQGDTLFYISFLFGVSVDQIKQMNGLTSDIISIGQRLIVKAASGPTATPTTAAPAASNTPDPNTQPTADPNNPTADPNSPTAQPTAPATAAVSPTPGLGKVCALLWNDANGNGLRDNTETMLAGGQLAVVDVATGAPVQAYTTDGLTEPHCFENLAEGQYTISAVPPSGYNPTTAGSTSMGLKSGDVASLEFGAQPSSAGGGSGGDDAGSTDRVLRTALLGAAGIMFLLLALGIGAFLFFRRR